MLVQYHERFDVIAEFDPESGRVQPLPRPDGLSPGGTDGWFAILGGVCVVFYRQAARLRLQIGGRTFDLDGDASVDWRVEDRTAVFTVTDESGQVMLRYTSGPSSGPWVSDDPTPFVEEEDWDLGLFISNVIFDEERSDLVRRGPS